MSRRTRQRCSLLLALVMTITGCHPARVYYFGEDGDLSHYRGVATDIEYPDVEADTTDDVRFAHRPLTLENFEDHETWELCLHDAIHIALANSKVIRTLNTSQTSPPFSRPLLPSPDQLLSNPDFAVTVFDSALQASSVTNANGGIGVEAALSEFDAQLSASMFWERNERPINVLPGSFASTFFARNFEQDQGVFQAELAKTTASGSRFFARHNVEYESNNNSGQRVVPSDFTVNYEFGVTQPLLRGAGAMFNRIAGPSGQPGFYQGVMIARINQDVKLAEFEAHVRNLVSDIENAYWALYLAYRTFDSSRAAAMAGRDKDEDYEGFGSALDIWQKVKAKYDVGAEGGDAASEAQARSEYYNLRGAMEQAACDLFRVETRLRYLMGLAASDGRLIRPSDEPTTAKVVFNWDDVHCEALARSTELRRQKWRVKQRELELIASRNFLLPRLDAVALYRFLGVGDDLIHSNGNGVPPFTGSDAYSTLTDGDYQEWQLGFQLSMNLGFRQELAGVRNAQLQLARDRAVLQDQELEVSHLLTDAVRNLECNYVITQTLFNNWMAARLEARSVAALYKGDVSSKTQGATFNDLRTANARRDEAERGYYGSLVNYNKSILEVHFRKGSLLEYNGVLLAEGPWPGKAYFDARRRARQRDAALFLDYGVTRPGVFSRGPVQQHVHHPGEAYVEPTPTEWDLEEVPLHRENSDEGGFQPAESGELPPVRPNPPLLNSPGDGATARAPRDLFQRRNLANSPLQGNARRSSLAFTHRQAAPPENSRRRTADGWTASRRFAARPQGVGLNESPTHHPPAGNHPSVAVR